MAYTESHQPLSRRGRFFSPPRGWFLLVATIFLVHALLYYPYFSDDAFISLRYAKRLLQGHGLTWTDGETVEGYTNFLWVILNAGLGALGVDLVLAARIWGILGALAALFFVSLSPTTGRLEPVRILSAGLFLALSAPIAVWAVGGLEQGFMAGLLAGAVYYLFRAVQNDGIRRRELLVSSFFFAVLAITRADAAVLCIPPWLALAVYLGRRPGAVNTLIIFAELPLLFAGSHLLFRYLYYGELVPDWAAAKMSFSDQRFTEGIRYLLGVARILLVPMTVALLGVAVAFRRIPWFRWSVPLALLVLFSTYLVVVGGDTFYAWRRGVPLAVAVAFLMGEGMSRLATLAHTKRLVAAVAVTILGGVFVVMQMDDEKCSSPRTRNHWEWNGQAFGDLLKRAFPDDRPLIAVEDAGALPYFSELPALDMLGHNNRYLTEHPPKSDEEDAMTQALGDPDYILERAPDIIVFNQATGDPAPTFRSGKALVEKAAFKNQYQPAMFHPPGGNRVVSKVYLKKEDGPLGMTKTPSRLVVPAYFLSAGGRNPALMDRKGAFYLPIDEAATASIDNLLLDAGTWKVDTFPPLKHIPKRITCGNGKLEKADMDPVIPTTNPVVSLSKRMPIGLTIGPGNTDKAQRLNRVTFSRVSKEEANQRCVGNKASALHLGSTSQSTAEKSI